MSVSPVTIGLFGGTFDPVHVGHLIIADAIRIAASLDTVIFIPSARPPHKGDTTLFSAQERFAMLKLAVQGNTSFHASDIEMKREGLSYTIDTIRELKRLHPDTTEFTFIVGVDNLREMQMWKNPREILDECRVIAAKRICDTDRPVSPWIRDKVETIDVPLIEVSSSLIRQRIRSGRSIRYLVPELVRQEIVRLGKASPD